MAAAVSPPPSASLRLAQLDSLTAFFLYWRPEHVAHMLRAMGRFIATRGNVLNDERRLLEQQPHIPALPGVPDDAATETLFDAVERFGALWPRLPPTLAADVRQCAEDWLYAVWLATVATSLSAQELMFADDPGVRLYRGTRSPWSGNVQRLRPVLARELALFRDGGWCAPRRFVDQCRAFYCYGLEESAFLPPPPPLPSDTPPGLPV